MQNVQHPTEVNHEDWRALNAIFAPQNVAVVGATEKAGSVGRTILWNLLSNPFGGTIFPVNPKRPNVLGIKAYATVKDIPEPIDLAVIVTPAPTVPGVVRECVEKGAHGAIIISAGFKETGAAGAELERQVMAEARKGQMRIIGPNCLGAMSPLNNFNATFAGAMARPGNVGFISQSGALCTSVLDWSFKENVGFSAFVSIGSMLDVGWGDLIHYLGDDPNTHSIVIYMETVGNARAFLSAAREVALNKPIIVIKAGRTEAAAHAAASHTGSLTGSDEVLDIAFKRCGVLRIDRISDLFYMSEVLAKQPRPKGARLTIVTNAGGPGVLATDALILGGGELAEISPETMQELNDFLPSAWSHNNPIDILGDAEPARYAKALEVAAKDPHSDGMLVILTPQDMTDPTLTAEQLKPYAQSLGKPVIASWMGGESVAAGELILNRANIPTFPYPDTAARVFNYMWQYNDNLRSLYETPAVTSGEDDDAPDTSAAAQVISAARSAGRTLLTVAESKQLLLAYGIPTVPTHIATTEDAAVQAADKLGYPIVLKLHSFTITHKTDVDGVQLNLRSADDVRAAYRRIQAGVTQHAGAGHFDGVTVQPMAKLDGYEIIVGCSIDPQFGPVLLFGTGGTLVEVFKDRALALPPLNTTLARRMMEQTKIYTALKGVRGRKAADLAGLERLLVRFSQLVAENRWIKEIDINPLLVSPERLLALDARVVLHEPDMREDQIVPLAIRPYPAQYVAHTETRDGMPITIRPIKPEDEPLLVKFHQTLSERTVYQRFFYEVTLKQRISHERLARICFIDYDRELWVVVTRRDDSGEHIIAAGHIGKYINTADADFVLLVSDQYQQTGVGHRLLTHLIEIARQEGVTRLLGQALAENATMVSLAEKLGFRVEPRTDSTRVKFILDL
ncbi:MAG: bifunctional acetate--CoA ligase family protein/GNAT family N-acetyltransferase [Chloroflexi bacterium]|nr:bifunctional acetate--CoA ligase family protein/GNAT family N-acetyltransferase [Chloroflexota bacterium]